MAPDSSSSLDPRPLSTRLRLALLSGAALSGLTVTFAPAVLALVLGLPALLLLVVSFCETTLVLFLTAGVYKQDSFLVQYMPIDTTVCLGLLLLLATGIAVCRRPIHFPKAMWLLAPTFLVILVGLGLGPGEYGLEKGQRFLTLTLLVIVSSVILLGERRALERFLGSLALMAVLLTLYAAQSPENTSMGRLTVQGSSPIAFARIATLSLAFGWLRLHFARRPFEFVASIAILAVSSYGVLAAGSRGPLISLILSMVLISLVTASHHGRSVLSMRLLLILTVLVILTVALANIPSLPLYRFQLLLSGDKGASILSRGILFATAWQLMLAHPLGLGVGGFAKHAILDLRYPHNLFLEVGSELGWLPLAALLVLIGCSLRQLVGLLRAEYSWTTLFLAIVVLTALLNSMVSGDLNDNRLLFCVLLLPMLVRQPAGATRVKLNAGA